MTSLGVGVGMADKDSETPNDGNELRSWRKRMGWTQARAADELKMHLNSVKNIEGGKRSLRSSVRRLLDTLERPESRGAKAASGKPANSKPGLAPAPTDGHQAADAELIEVGRQFGKVSAAYVTAALAGAVTADLEAAMRAAEAQVHQAQAKKDAPWSEHAMSIFGAFIQLSNAAHRATHAALNPSSGAAPAQPDIPVLVLDRRNQLVATDLAHTITAEGEGSRQAVITVHSARRATPAEARELMGLANDELGEVPTDFLADGPLDGAEEG